MQFMLRNDKARRPHRYIFTAALSAASLTPCCLLRVVAVCSSPPPSSLSLVLARLLAWLGAAGWGSSCTTASKGQGQGGEGGAGSSRWGHEDGRWQTGH